MKKLFLPFLLALISISAHAQLNEDLPPNAERREEVRAVHDAFITRELDLSAKESQAFWPVYNEFLKKREDLKRERKKLISEASAAANHDAILEKLSKLDEDEYRLKVTYTQKLIPIIGAKRVIELERSERDFKRFLLHRLREQNPMNHD